MREGSASSDDALVDETLHRIAERTKANDAVGATREAEKGLAQWEKEEAEREAESKARGVKLLEAALNTDLLRFDAEAAANRVEKIVALEHEGDHNVQFLALRIRQNQFYVEGRDEGVTFRLGVAIAIARREVALAQASDERGAAWNDLGNALGTLAEREGGTVTLQEAVSAYRASLEESPRERVPLLWATTQNNLGNALRVLGSRESGTTTLRQAIVAFRETLQEWTRDRVPQLWSITQNNLGTALVELGERDSDTATLQEAVSAFREALKERTRESVPLDWAMTQSNLGEALRALGEGESGTTTLQQAVVAYREALKELTRERVPLLWATAQNNLGHALLRLGERESETATLQEAVSAYREALKERTRERVPLDWAMSFGGQGVAMMRLAERTKDASMAKTALAQINAAYETALTGGHTPLAAVFEARLPEARAVLERLGGR